MSPDDQEHIRAEFVKLLQDNLNNRLSLALCEGMLLIVTQILASRLDRAPDEPTKEQDHGKQSEPV